MAPTWTVRRQISPHRDGERRWDQAYQLLVRWAMARPDGERAVGPMPQEVPAAHGVYARVSTPRQAQAQTIKQQLERLRAAVGERGWVLDAEHVYRDDGYSGATLSRPGLDRLRDHAALAELDVVVVTAPDRLARNLRPSGAAGRGAWSPRLPGGVPGPSHEPGSPRPAAAGRSAGRWPSMSAP